ncbi:hypothetical protein CLV24_12322 [Pontibacter ummariensis]|uniref:SpoIIAA-like n=1 Tax=Pontibacter ummariensis TaxID=1610492 RepID=A0A239JPD6_9BACT|nr:hypothetical protein [Pontibacter ummariensis]PRY07373.1 hypothetical protein CLV24_12322 [Pontibacter ummariensis]SNT07886.1 hypothetical protein SAMN06296052_12322 [Pontibacter ummariensis]
MPLSGLRQDIIYSTPELLVCVYPSLQLLVIQANGFVPSAVYREGLTRATDTAIEQRLLYWLVNNKAGGIITPADQIWANEEHAPYLGSHSCIRKMAFIEPGDLHSKLILEDMMDKARDIYPFAMQFFEEVQDALEWFTDTSSISFHQHFSTGFH